MGDLKDLALIVSANIPLIVVETFEERRTIDLFRRLSQQLDLPLFTWSVTDGLRREDLALAPQQTNAEPTKLLKHIKSGSSSGLYVLLDFHPYFEDPINARLIKEIAQEHYKNKQTLVFVSHDLQMPDELAKSYARFELQLPDREQLLSIIKEEAFSWSAQNGRQKVKTDSKTLDRMVMNLSGLTVADAKRLARQVIFDDGAITESDLPEVIKAKYELLGQDGVLAFEYETERFANVGGMQAVKRWLELRKGVFHGAGGKPGLDAPKGILLLGVQGCGKSLVAKAVAGVFGAPLLRLDFGALYNKFFGESERNLREALKTAEVMAPCVLWVDEIEKGISTGDNDGGTSRRVLGTLLTWMAEKSQAVFLVATANDIEALPPELIRKGRFDEIFFVDLPGLETRKQIFRIHLEKRAQASSRFDLQALGEQSEGFSGAEIEQAIVAALYVVHAENSELTTEHLLAELARTRPLSVVMAEKIQYLRAWAQSRTVPVE